MRYSTRRSAISRVGRSLRRYPLLWIGAFMVGVVILVAVFAPVLSPYPPNQMDILNQLAAPSARHLLGTDNFGRDILTRIFYGGRVSLLVGFASVVIAGVIGTTLGLVASHFGGIVDTLIMRLTDIVLSFPVILLALALVAVLGPSVRDIILALGLGYWASYARLVRAAGLEVREEQYIEAARSVGNGDLRIMLRYMLPNVLGPILVMATLGVGSAIVAEASLSFLGLGVQPPTASWGAMIADGLRFFLQSPNLSTFPGFAIMWTVLGFNLLGDGLSDYFNPKINRGRRGAQDDEEPEEESLDAADVSVH